MPSFTTIGKGAGPNKSQNWLNFISFDNHEKVVKTLFRLGHFIPLGYDMSLEAEEMAIKASRANSELLATAVRSLQSYTPVAIDGDFGPKTQAAVKARFCSAPDILPAGALPKWSFHDLVVWHDMGANLIQPYMDACNLWALHTPLMFDWWNEGDNKPNIFAHARRIDGVGGVLAWSYLPPPNAGRGVQLEQRYDTADGFNIPTACHEIGHALGLSHIQKPEALMYPYMNGTKKPEAPDIEAIQNLYGASNPSDPTDPSDPSDPDDPGDDDTFPWILKEETHNVSSDIVYRIKHWIDKR